MPIDLTKLRAARDLLARPSGWTQGANARNIEGTKVCCSSEHAVCFCLNGATLLCEFDYDGWLVVNDYVQDKFGEDMTEFNDTLSRTKAEVVAVLDAVIAENTPG